MITIVCLGSEWYRDDRAGLEVCKRLQFTLKELVDKDIVNIVMCEVGIERCLGYITRSKFNLLIIVDAVYILGDHQELKDKFIVIEGYDKLKDVALDRVSTHKMSLTLILDFLKYVTGRDFHVLFIGIPVQDLTICSPDEECPLSENVRKIVSEVVSFLREKILEYLRRCGIERGRE